MENYATGPGPDEPVKPKAPKNEPTGSGAPAGDNESFYVNNAKFAYYRERLTTALRNKDPQSFDAFIKAVGEARRTNPSSVEQLVQSSNFSQSLSPDEVKSVLGNDFADYVKTLSQIVKTQRNIPGAPGYNKDQNLVGANENQSGISDLMFGKRFATLPVVSSASKTIVNQSGGSKETTKDDYVYNPKTKSVVKYRTVTKG